MKKVMLSALALCCSLAALAQAPTTPDARRTDQTARERRHEAKIKIKQHDDDHDDDRAGQPANHGQNVSAVAKSTTLTGADKGAAVSTVARGGHGADHDMGNARSARGEHAHAGRPAGSGHQGGGHSMGGGHHGSH